MPPLAAWATPLDERRGHLLALYEQLALVRQRLDTARQRVDGVPTSRLEIGEAHDLIARNAGFEDWPAFVVSLASRGSL
jgi:hypothetical protein